MGAVVWYYSEEEYIFVEMHLLCAIVILTLCFEYFEHFIEHRTIFRPPKPLAEMMVRRGVSLWALPLVGEMMVTGNVDLSDPDPNRWARGC